MAAIAPEAEAMVSFEVQDLLVQQPQDRFDLILCRNCAFMYFDAAGQNATLEMFADRLWAGGALVIGRNDGAVEVHPAGTNFQRIFAQSTRAYENLKVHN